MVNKMNLAQQLLAEIDEAKPAKEFDSEAEAKAHIEKELKGSKTATAVKQGDKWIISIVSF